MLESQLEGIPVRSDAHPGRVLGLSLLGVAVASGVDHVTGHEIRVYPLYFLPIAYCAWNSSRRYAAASALTSTLAWLGSNLAAAPDDFAPHVWVVNFLAQLLAFSLVGLLIAELRRRLLLEHSLSRRDALTGLPNGRAFHENAELLLALSRRSGSALTFAYVDLDNFKQVNDQHGHQEGDRALVIVGEVLKRHCRSSDLVTRLGGDEFALLLSHAGASNARASLERLRDLIAQAMHREHWPITASIGAITYSSTPPSLAEALKEADATMYRAKHAGKDRVHVEVAGTQAAQ